MTGGRSTNSAMYLWFTNDLANITADWTIASLASSAAHQRFARLGPRGRIDRDAAGFPARAGAGWVDLVLSGIVMFMSVPICLDQHYGDSFSFNDTMKLDAGSGRENDTGVRKNLFIHTAPRCGLCGGLFRLATGGALNHPAMRVSLNEMGSLVLDVLDQRHFLRATRARPTTRSPF